MCLAIPGKIEQIFEQDSLKMAKVNIGGLKKTICLQYTPEARPGDFVLIHVGFSLSIIDVEEAKRTLQALKMTGEFSEFTAQEESDAIR